MSADRIGAVPVATRCSSAAQWAGSQTLVTRKKVRQAVNFENLPVAKYRKWRHFRDLRRRSVRTPDRAPPRRQRKVGRKRDVRGPETFSVRDPAAEGHQNHEGLGRPRALKVMTMHLGSLSDPVGSHRLEPRLDTR